MVHLQGYGDVHTTKRAGDLQPGDVILWNFGYTSTVVEIVKRTKKMIVVKTITPKGEVYERKFGQHREMPIKEEK